MTKNQKLKVFNKVNKNTLMDFMDIEYVDIGDDFLLAKMPGLEILKAIHPHPTLSEARDAEFIS